MQCTIIMGDPANVFMFMYSNDQSVTVQHRVEARCIQPVGVNEPAYILNPDLTIDLRSARVDTFPLVVLT